jgi:hypothetical protein
LQKPEIRRMPFKSEAQRKFLYVKHPRIAAKWSKEFPNQGKLPKHVKKAAELLTSAEADRLRREIIAHNWRTFTQTMSTAPYAAMTAPAAIGGIIGGGFGGVGGGIPGIVRGGLTGAGMGAGGLLGAKLSSGIKDADPKTVGIGTLAGMGAGGLAGYLAGHALTPSMIFGAKPREDEEKLAEASASGIPARMVGKFIPIDGSRRELTPEEQKEVDEKSDRLLPDLIQTDTTPIPNMMSNPKKQGLLAALLGGAAGAAGGYYGGQAAGISPVGSSIGLGTLAAMLAGIPTYLNQHENSQRMLEVMKRLPKGATRRDYNAEEMLASALARRYGEENLGE